MAPSALAQKKHLHSNALMTPCNIDAYIVVYDCSAGSHRNSSCEKAWNIIRDLKQIHGAKKGRSKKKEHPPKFYLFANKCDLLTAFERNRMRMTQVSKITKQNRFEKEVQFAMGSAILNEATPGAESKPLSIANFLVTVCKQLKE